MKNETRFKENMTVLCELFDKPLSMLLMGIYWKALAPFTDEQCERAFKEIMLSSKFFPKPADFIEAMRGKEDDRATRAWIKVVEAVRQHGHYESIQFDDAVIHSVIQFMGGWPKTGEWTDKDLKWIEKEFVRLYSIMGASGKHPTYLPGAHEISNAAQGYDIKAEIVKIGFEGKSQKQIAVERVDGPRLAAVRRDNTDLQGLQ